MTDEVRLRDYEGWKKSLSNFAWLKDAAPGMSDVDGMIHCRGRDRVNYFLILEFKNKGERLSLGQKILLEAQREQPNTEVVTVYGPDKDGLYLLTMSWTGKVDQEGLRTMVANWWSTHKKGL